MADPLGLIGGGGIDPSRFTRPATTHGGQAGDATGPSFKDTLLKQIDQANELQQEATRAVEDLATGSRSDLEGVILATQKADTAFRMLQQLRNRMMEAYDEIKQMRT